MTCMNRGNDTNELRVRFPQPTPRLVEWTFAEGIGYHWMAGYG